MKTILKNPGKVAFTGIILDAGNSGGAYLEFPFSTQEIFGTNNRIPVRINFNGELYRGSLVRMGTECHIVPILKTIREKIGKGIGDSVEVEVFLDDEPRLVEVPQDVQDAMKKNLQAKEKFTALSYSHQREYVLWIDEAKKVETRQRRIEKLIATLLSEKTQKN
ncbi:MAG: DUF1905 domain-containing protein [Anaerolineaceae bacterium]|nr:DUF1905 domain-containing protein [Anaerolineaceae bacterium]